MFCGELDPVRHRALHLGLLHAESDGLVELTPGTRPPGGKVEIDRRTRPEHFLPGGATEPVGWLEGMLEHARRIGMRGCVGAVEHHGALGPLFNNRPAPGPA